MTGRVDWASVEVAYRSVPEGTETWRAVRLALGAVLELYDQVMDLAEKYENLRDREALDTRLAALRSAREIVNAMPSEQPNSRGYHDHAMKPAERIAQELHIARFLLGDRP